MRRPPARGSLLVLMVTASFAALLPGAAAGAACPPSAPMDEVLALLDAVVASVGETGSASTAFLDASSENLTEAVATVLEGLPGAVVIPFTNVENILLAFGAWGTGAVFVVGDLAIVLLDGADHAVNILIEGLRDCVPA